MKKVDKFIYGPLNNCDTIRTWKSLNFNEEELKYFYKYTPINKLTGMWTIGCYNKERFNYLKEAWKNKNVYLYNDMTVLDDCLSRLENKQLYKQLDESDIAVVTEMANYYLYNITYNGTEMPERLNIFKFFPNILIDYWKTNNDFRLLCYSNNTTVSGIIINLLSHNNNFNEQQIQDINNIFQYITTGDVNVEILNNIVDYICSCITSSYLKCCNMLLNIEDKYVKRIDIDAVFNRSVFDRQTLITFIDIFAEYYNIDVLKKHINKAKFKKIRGYDTVSEMYEYLYQHIITENNSITAYIQGQYMLAKMKECN